MSEIRRKYDPEFKAGVVRIVQETRRPAAEIARELEIGASTLSNATSMSFIASQRTDHDIQCALRQRTSLRTIRECTLPACSPSLTVAEPTLPGSPDFLICFVSISAWIGRCWPSDPLNGWRAARGHSRTDLSKSGLLAQRAQP